MTAAQEINQTLLAQLATRYVYWAARSRAERKYRKIIDPDTRNRSLNINRDKSARRKLYGR